jgi:hypothetical protein
MYYTSVVLEMLTLNSTVEPRLTAVVCFEICPTVNGEFFQHTAHMPFITDN